MWPAKIVPSRVIKFDFILASWITNISLSKINYCIVVTIWPTALAGCSLHWKIIPIECFKTTVYGKKLEKKPICIENILINNFIITSSHLFTVCVLFKLYKQLNVKDAMGKNHINYSVNYRDTNKPTNKQTKNE